MSTTKTAAPAAMLALISLMILFAFALPGAGAGRAGPVYPVPISAHLTTVSALYSFPFICLKLPKRWHPTGDSFEQWAISHTLHPHLY